MSDDLAGRAVIVTAAGRGIGQATAEALHEVGARLVLADVDDSALQATAQKLGADEGSVAGRGPVITVVGDVTRELGAATIVSAAIEAFGRIDVLVNVVGGSRPGRKVTDMTLADWQADLDLNLTSTFLMARAVIPPMAAAGHGVIVNVSSGAGLTGMRNNAAYCAAKAGVAMLTRTLAIDHSEDGIRVNGIAPGPVLTPLMERNRSPEEIAFLGRHALVGRVGRPDEMASVIRFLASDASSYINGETIPVNGGIAPHV